MGESEGKRRKRGKETPAVVPTVHPQVFDDAIRPVLRQIARDLTETEKDLGVRVDYHIVYPPHSKSPQHDVRLTIEVTFREAHTGNAARFDALQEEVMTRFLVWLEDWEQMLGLPPTKGGWHTRKVYDV